MPYHYLSDYGVYQDLRLLRSGWTGLVEEIHLLLRVAIVNRDFYFQ